MTLKAVRAPMSYLSRIALLGCIRDDVDALERSLPPEIAGSTVASDGAERPTGVRELTGRAVRTRRNPVN